MHLLLLVTLMAAAATAETECGQVKVNPMGARAAGAAVAQTGNAVTGGSQAAEGAWPWTVSICRMDWFGTCQFYAAGTIISENWVITSLTGIDPALKTRYRVRAGTTSNANGGQFIQLENIMHPKSANTVEHKADIALIELHTSLQFNDFVQSICLPSNDDDVVKPLSSAWFAGWGKTNVSSTEPAETYLHQTQMNIMTNGLGCPAYFDKTTQICGRGASEGNVCTFDVGGPLVQQVADGRWFLYGIAAAMNEFGGSDCNQSSILNRVSAFCEYIQETSNVSCQ